MCALGHNIITLDRLLREAQTDRRKSNGSGPFYRTGPTHSNKSLVGLGALLSYLGAAAGSLRFAFLVRRDARCLRLVLLGPAFASEVVTTSHAPDDFFGLAFNVLDPPQWRTWFERLTPLPIHQATGQVIRRNAVLLLKTLNPAPRWCGFPCRHTLKHLMPPCGHSCR
jgi:hypothetical protein